LRFGEKFSMIFVGAVDEFLVIISDQLIDHVAEFFRIVGDNKICVFFFTLDEGEWICVWMEHSPQIS